MYNRYMDKEKNVIHLQVRLASEEYEAIKRLAQEHARSLNGEIVTAIRAYIKNQKGKESDAHLRIQA
jgi:hypothetical protein